MPFFSVIIPLYNKEKHIKQTLESVLNQTFQDFEVIVIDDGSTDSSEKEVLSVQNSKIRIFTIENRGVSFARNYGIEKSEGNLIAFLDADDYWYPNHLEDLYSLYQKYPKAGLFATNYEFYYSENQIEKPCFLDISSDFESGIVDDFFKSSYVYRLAWTSAVAVPCEVFSSVGKFDENISYGASGEDTDMWTRIALQYKTAFHNRISARYLMNTENKLTNYKVSERTFPKLDKFLEEEKENHWLKKFLDLYRSEYAIKHKTAGNKKAFYFYKSGIDSKNLNFKTKVLFMLPVSVLRVLYKIKKLFNKKGVAISTYH